MDSVFNTLSEYTYFCISKTLLLLLVFEIVESLQCIFKDLNNVVSLNQFKVLEEKKIDWKENQHNEQKDLISPSAD